MAKFSLAFGIHNHQPVGNFDHVFEYAHRKAYQPFLEVLSSFGLSISLHQSGILWDWQEKHHPEYLETVRDLIKSERLELMTGGFYEPILTSIPERDVEGQIDMLNQYLRRQFGVNPDGLWLTERIWEPHLPGLLARAGVKFLPVDDTHFIYAGFEHSQLTGPFVTEHENSKVILLPISKRLRYLIPFGTVSEVIDELKALADKDPGGVVVYADDGEKFGSWPKTHEHCYTDRWLANFFEALRKNSDWLEVVPLSRAAARKPAGRAYLPSASYAEMLHWSLPPRAFVAYENFENYLKVHGQLDRFGRFVRGGHWRGFLAKYEESNLMHKKMLAVSERLRAAQRQEGLNPDKLSRARDRLYAGQCNCPYWHGVFGGLYLPHIRQAVYSALVEADQTLASLSGKECRRVDVTDYDADGADEIIVENPGCTAVFRPHRGGNLIELSLNQKNFSITDTLTRRKEGYHLKLDKAVTPDESAGTASIHDLVLAKEPGLKGLLVDDWYLKRCFIDHFFDGDVDFDTFRSGAFREDGDFVLEPYLHNINPDTGTITLQREGHLWKPDGLVPVLLIKRFDFDDTSARIDISYELSTDHSRPIEINFALENNFNLQAGHDEARFVLIDDKRHANSFLDSLARHSGVASFAIIDRPRDIALALTCDRTGDIWHLPLFTVSLSEGGFEKVYQGTTFVNRFSLTLGKEPVRLNFRLVAGSVDSVTRDSQSARQTAP